MNELVIKKIRTTSGDVQIEPIQASTTQLGGVKVDGDTITINNGVISCPQIGDISSALDLINGEEI